MSIRSGPRRVFAFVLVSLMIRFPLVDNVAVNVVVEAVTVPSLFSVLVVVTLLIERVLLLRSFVTVTVVVLV